MEHRQENQTMDGKFIPMTSLTNGLVQQVAEGVFSYTIQIVNIAMVRTSNDFVLIDTGMPESEEKIFEIVEEIFGENAKPEAIILTHGHFDHVGSIEKLLTQWDVPVYAHPLEIPYLTGQKNYPDPDGTVEGGLVAKISPMFPNEGVHLGNHVKPLPDNGELPHLSEWKWIHTPGHSDGHISLFREKDRTLIAGDAFITVKQDSLAKVLVQEREVNGPPRYLTTDWQLAKKSVEKLAALHPRVAVTGHGLPMEGEELEQGLTKLVNEFDTIAVPDYGKFV
ncbi:MBL fold metallo-hydrolase [Caldifermentibacillus hisashii]|jgi:glyoxylase-like metal-dependent hydrolase (beta-lactamase superfamily II)|uniref:MBL fold metallo-hydrolase n=1 Tax=Caldifermentibacillus hisashii TaxID=996558 RepID=UPI000BA4D89D|nr:MBL fold metallo-hydrolase [Caldifermentibacillus hisashii]PAC35436.1 MBL fold metallo-hydrolase [Caldifermentibacillus hisashii]